MDRVKCAICHRYGCAEVVVKEYNWREEKYDGYACGDAVEAENHDVLCELIFIGERRCRCGRDCDLDDS